MIVSTALLANQRRFFTGYAGVYAVTFAHEVENMLEGKPVPVKVGWSSDIAKRISVGSIDATFLPSPLVVARVYEPTEEVWAGLSTREEKYATLNRYEMYCHEEIGAFRLKYNTVRGSGAEWFLIPVQELDKRVLLPTEPIEKWYEVEVDLAEEIAG